MEIGGWSGRRLERRRELLVIENEHALSQCASASGVDDKEVDVIA
jgi:hypothetical protein